MNVNRRSGRRVGLLMGLALFASVASLYTMHEVALATSIAKGVAGVEQSYQQHRWSAAIDGLVRLDPLVRGLRMQTRWVELFGFVPAIGPRVRIDERVLSVLQDVTEAAYDARPFLRQLEAKRSVMAAMRKLRLAAVVASAQGIDAMARLPTFPARSPFVRLNQLKQRVHSLLSFSRLILTHPQMVRLLLGTDHPDRFLLIFQDNGELRSTGGFIAADGLLTLYHGQIRIQFNSDIANTADAIRIHDPAPWVLRTYFAERNISFINANLNPDVPASAQLIQKLYDSIPHHPRIDGMIFLDSWFIDRLVGVVGKVVAAGRTFTATNFYPEAEFLAEDRGLAGSTRMRFLGQILHDLEAKMQNPDMIGRVWPVFNAALQQKHLMIDADNPLLSQWLMGQHWTGALPVLSRVNRLLVLNDNYGGLKDNHFMTSGIGIALNKLTNGRYQETVTTTWTLIGIRNGWLVGTYVGWVQCYVPKGTTLKSLSGYHVHGVRMAVHSGLGMTAFGTGIEIAPRLSMKTPPHTETLVWVFILPRLMHPRKIDVIIQPGLPGQELEYQGQRKPVLVHQVRNEVVVVR